MAAQLTASVTLKSGERGDLSSRGNYPASSLALTMLTGHTVEYYGGVSTGADYSGVNMEPWDPGLSRLLAPSSPFSCYSSPISAFLLGKMRLIPGL